MISPIPYCMDDDDDDNGDGDNEYNGSRKV